MVLLETVSMQTNVTFLASIHRLLSALLASAFRGTFHDPVTLANIANVIWQQRRTTTLF